VLAVCGGTYHTTSGIIRSPGWPSSYPHGRECVWKIVAPPGQQIMLNFTAFNMENHTECNYDFLEIRFLFLLSAFVVIMTLSSRRNGGQESSSLVGRYCGVSIPQTIPSFTNQLWLKFASDGSMTGPGFEVYWDSTATGCGGLLTSAEGSFSSPSYPSPYHHRAECFWEVRVAKGSKIKFVFVDIDLETASECQ